MMRVLRSQEEEKSLRFDSNLPNGGYPANSRSASSPVSPPRIGVPPGGCRGTAGITLLLACLICGCAQLPPIKGRLPVTAVAPDESGPVARAVEPLTQAHPGKSGITLLSDGRHHRGVRVRLARQAAKSIDIRTYIWHEDATGTLLFEEMMQAAQRGVRVHILLDDADSTRKIDPILTLLAREPNVEVRLYNPFVGRGSQGYRIPDGLRSAESPNAQQVLYRGQPGHDVGGRNIADEYLGSRSKETGLVDLDAVAVGEVVREGFLRVDLYWNSPSAYAATADTRQRQADRSAGTHATRRA